MSASDTLVQARQARSRGDVASCILRAAACISEAEAERDYESVYWAHTALGMMHLGRAEPQEALAFFRWALEAVLAGGKTHLIGGAYHNLYLSGRDAGNGHAAKRHAEAALTLYRDFGKNHGLINALVADMAEADLTANPTPEQAAFAAECWRSCTATVATPRDRMIVGANAAFSASVQRIPVKFDRACEYLGAALKERESDEWAAFCLITAAQAAARMRDFERCRNLAQMAVVAATARNELVLLAQAEEVRSAALAERAARL